MANLEVDAATAAQRELRYEAARLMGRDGTMTGFMFKSPPNVGVRRYIGNWLLSRNFLFPYEVNVRSQDAVEKAESHLKNGGGIVIEVNHFSKRDIPQIVVALPHISDHFISPPYYGPLGKHQKKPYILPITDFWGMEWNTVTTPDTLRALERDRRDGKKVTMPTREEIDEEKRAYLSGAVDVLEKPGVVIIAPHGGRRSKFGEFRGNPMSMIVAAARERGFENIAFLAIGIGEKGRETYEVVNYEAGKLFTLDVGECITLQEIEDVVRQNPIDSNGGKVTIDSVLHDVLLEVVPQGFRP